MFGALIPMGVSHKADAILKLVMDYLRGISAVAVRRVCGASSLWFKILWLIISLTFVILWFVSL